MLDAEVQVRETAAQLRRPQFQRTSDEWCRPSGAPPAEVLTCHLHGRTVPVSHASGTTVEPYSAAEHSPAARAPAGGCTPRASAYGRVGRVPRKTDVRNRAELVQLIWGRGRWRPAPTVVAPVGSRPTMVEAGAPRTYLTSCAMAGSTSIGGTPRATDDRTAGGGTRPPPLNSPSQTPARSTRPSPHSATRTLCAPSAETADAIARANRALARCLSAGEPARVDRGWFLIRLHAASTLGHRCASGEAAAWLLPEGAAWPARPATSDRSECSAGGRPVDPRPRADVTRPGSRRQRASGDGPNPTTPKSLLKIRKPSFRTTTPVIFPPGSCLLTSLAVNLHPSASEAHGEVVVAELLDRLRVAVCDVPRSVTFKVSALTFTRGQCDRHRSPQRGRPPTIP